MKRCFLLLILVLSMLIVNTNCNQTNTQTDNGNTIVNQAVYQLDSLYGGWMAIRYLDIEGKYVDLDTCDFEARVHIGVSYGADKGFFNIGVSDGCNSGKITYHITPDGEIDEVIPGPWTQKYCSPEEIHWYPSFRNERLVIDQQPDGEVYMYAISISRVGMIQENDTVIILKKISQP